MKLRDDTKLKGKPLKNSKKNLDLKLIEKTLKDKKQTNLK